MVVAVLFLLFSLSDTKKQLFARRLFLPSLFMNPVAPPQLAVFAVRYEDL
jgi:hypothetical protein